MHSIMDSNRGLSPKRTTLKRTISSTVNRTVTTPRFFWRAPVQERARITRCPKRHLCAGTLQRISHVHTARRVDSCTRSQCPGTRIKIIIVKGAGQRRFTTQSHRLRRLPHARTRSPLGLATRMRDEMAGAPSRPCPMLIFYYLGLCK